jgi:hypothetical protein
MHPLTNVQPRNEVTQFCEIASKGFLGGRTTDLRGWTRIMLMLTCFFFYPRLSVSIPGSLFQKRLVKFDQRGTGGGG